ncbi:hypothetical protein DICVIV_13600, partial [Dictyocaulus viviparus]
PKRDLDVDGDNDYYSPTGFNRTYFAREAYQRRRITEAQYCDIGTQTGETIRLRQKMFFGKDSSVCYPMEHGAQVKDPCCDVFERSPNNSPKNVSYLFLTIHFITYTRITVVVEIFTKSYRWPGTFYRQHLKLGEHVTPTTEQDEIVSTDSRVDLRRASTPVLNRVDSGLANAFGCVTSIPSRENSADVGYTCK